MALETIKNGASAGTAAGIASAGGGVRVIAVSSGKGGVGKTNMVANLAVAYAQDKKRVLALDGDLGMANLDLALGVTPDKSLLDVLQGHASIKDVICPAVEGIHIISGCSGRYELANMEERERHNLFAAIDSLENLYDVLLIDTAAGIGSNAISFAGAAQQVVMVATPEPTSLADVYAFIKVLSQKCGVERVFLVANMVSNPQEGEMVYARLSQILDRFLGVGLSYLGHVPKDNTVPRCIRQGRPMLVVEPDAPASRAVRAIARKLSETPGEIQSGGIRLFWKRLLDWKEAS